MTLQIELDQPVEAVRRVLSESDQAAIAQRLERLRDDPWADEQEKFEYLSDRAPFPALHMYDDGSWRIIYRIDTDRSFIEVMAVARVQRHSSDDQSAEVGEGKTASKPAQLLDRARERAQRFRAHLLRMEGEPLREQDVAARLQIDPEAVEDLRRRDQILGLPMETGEYVYPSWQFGLAGLDAVLHDLGVRDRWMRAAFLLNGNLQLNGESPLAVLRRGSVSAVRRAARAHGEQGAA